MNLPQLRAIQKAIIEKAKMSMGIFGGGTVGRKSKADIEYEPDQFDTLVKARKEQLGKDTLSLEEVFGWQ